MSWCSSLESAGSGRKSKIKKNSGHKKKLQARDRGRFADRRARRLSQGALSFRNAASSTEKINQLNLCIEHDRLQNRAPKRHERSQRVSRRGEYDQSLGCRR